MTIREDIQQELVRVMREGTHNEAFWQRLYGPSRERMNAERRERDGEHLRLTYQANSMPTTTVEERRAQRALLNRARKLKGELRARSTYGLKGRDEISDAWQLEVEEVANARDASVYITRAFHAAEFER